IEVRDRLCYHQFCDEPAHRCQADHIVPWSQGGRPPSGTAGWPAASTTASGTEERRRLGSEGAAKETAWLPARWGIGLVVVIVAGVTAVVAGFAPIVSTSSCEASVAA
ncbi:MAG TPA: HNH endonuclease signature motif containing protein, partial [Acidimicrobiales bacterium]|nr:HNH endonuclease signature motif containing protein [Acidimicrobiales bacterium]